MSEQSASACWSSFSDEQVWEGPRDDAHRSKHFRHRMRKKRNLPEPLRRAPLQAGRRSAGARCVAPAEQSHERRVCLHMLADGRSYRISFLSNTVADLKDLRTKITSGPPLKPSQIPFKKKRKKKTQSGADKNGLRFHGKVPEINLPLCASAPFLC